MHYGVEVNCKRSIIVGIIIFQGIIITCTLFNNTKTYAYVSEEIIKITKNNPIITETSGPFISSKNTTIFYGFPENINIEDKHQTYYILNIAEKDGLKFDIKYLYYMRKKVRIPSNAEYRGTFNVIPYGVPQRYQLKLCLWEVHKLMGGSASETRN